MKPQKLPPCCMQRQGGCSMTLQEKLQKYPPVLSVKDLEEILRISHNTAYALVRSGQIHSVRTGRNYRIPINAVVDYLKKN